MRLAKLYVRTAVLVSLIAVACACQSAQKPVSLLPPASAPALKPAVVATQTASTVPPAVPQQETPQKPAPAEDAAPPSAPAPDAIADLIVRVEKEYQAGLANYHAGKTDEAKQNFDDAVNALLGSNFDVRSDDRLQKEFDRVVQGVNELYPGGPDAAEGSQEAQQDQQQQKTEPAPIDETNGMTPAADAGTKAKAEAEIKSTHSDLPLMMTDQVAGFITYFSGRGRGVFERA